jgi:hypothetical protein
MIFPQSLVIPSEAKDLGVADSTGNGAAQNPSRS